MSGGFDDPVAETEERERDARGRFVSTEEESELAPLVPDEHEELAAAPENFGVPDEGRRTAGEVERTQRYINLGTRQLDAAPAGDSEGKEAALAPHATETALPQIPTQADFWLGGQGKAQQEAQRQDEEARRERAELERSRTPTGRTLREQKRGEKQLADYQAGAKRDREIEVGQKALESHKGRLPAGETETTERELETTP